LANKDIFSQVTFILFLDKNKIFFNAGHVALEKLSYETSLCTRKIIL